VLLRPGFDFVVLTDCPTAPVTLALDGAAFAIPALGEELIVCGDRYCFKSTSKFLNCSVTPAKHRWVRRASVLEK